MTVICSNCTTRLQIDEAKLPSRSFTVRCPKCQKIINGQPTVGANEPAGASDRGAFAVGDSPALGNSRFKSSTPAPVFKLDSAPEGADVQAYGGDASSADSRELLRLLTELLQRGVSVAEQPRGATRLAWERRRTLVCSAPTHREAIARVLAENNYHVFVADDTVQAIERMREERIDIVIFDPNFDAVEQGASFFRREINALLPAERRRLFLVHISASMRTLDAHAAFINNVNLVINPADIENLPSALEQAMRDFNDLYRDFNGALSAMEL